MQLAVAIIGLFTANCIQCFKYFNDLFYFISAVLMWQKERGGVYSFSQHNTILKLVTFVVVEKTPTFSWVKASF